MRQKIITLFRNKNFVSLANNLVVAFFGFANVALLSRSLPKSDFGEWVIYLSGMAIIEMVRTGLNGTPLVRFLSGSQNKEESAGLIGASWVLSGLVTLTAILVLYSGYALFQEQIDAKGFGLFFFWYPILSLFLMPLNMTLSILQARGQFGRILSLRSISMGTFFLFLAINFFVRMDVRWVLVAHIASFALASIIAILMGWSGINHLLRAQKRYIREQLRFGRYSLGTLLGSNLLKSSDTFILGIMMTQADVAYYSIPLKLIEIVEIPIRSLVAVAFPRMSQESRRNRNFEVKRIFYTYTGIASLIFIPLVALLFLIAKPLTLILGGAEYASSYTLFWIFLIYALFLPMDRFSGVALDAVNRPRLNMYKVFFMAAANIIGDVLVIHYFGSLQLVAAVTIVNVIVGVFVGNLLLNRELGTRIWLIFPYGLRAIRDNLSKLLKPKRDE